MELDQIRNEINVFDNILKNMITLRMSLIPIVTKIKVDNNLPFYQGKREEAIYSSIATFAEKNGADENLLKEIYRQIIGSALNLEEKMAENNAVSIPENKEAVMDLKSEFEKLDNIIEKEIPQIINDITKKSKSYNLNLSEISTAYYKNKIKK